MNTGEASAASTSGTASPLLISEAAAAMAVSSTSGEQPLSARAPASGSVGDLTWRVVALTNLYRLLLPPVLIALYLFTRPTPTVGGSDPQIFFLVCGFYWVLGLMFAFGGRRHWPSRAVLAHANTLLDTLAVGALLYCSGGAGSGLGILLVIPVGAMALLGEGRGVFANAAVASLGILLQQIASFGAGNAPWSDFPLAGMQGAVVFLVALMAWPVSNRLRESEALMRRAVLDLANLAQVSQYIVQHLRESILVVDPDDYIRLINESAAQVLGEGNAVPGALLGEVSPRLLYLLSTWRRDDSHPDLPTDAQTLLAADGARVIRPHFAPLGDSNPSPVIVFLEDTGEIAARVQQTKLAALGRLSASIAHEIRNPVGAMSHAAQLLAESPGLSDEDRRLTQIMQANSSRVSGIIDNIMQLSRRETPKPQQLNLAAWTARFREEFCATLELPRQQLSIDSGGEDVQVRMDGSQLHQIVWNLCQNAMTHALPHAPAGSGISLRYGRLGGVGRPYLQVADRGPGIPSADADRIFEPFFTRAQRGTGLGLFLARELAAGNGATLLYEARDGGGSIFRVVFADPSRWRD